MADEKKDDAAWCEQLSPDEYHVLREKGTERAFTGEYWNTWEKGAYRCRGCGEVLFQSDTKFDAGCGWPSFDRPAAAGVTEEASDRTHGMIRTEVMCQRCGGHLGHVFPDGPTDTGQRYCINSLSIKFDPQNGDSSDC
jgi:peptide-methionine (R)-S-oxide reductase